MLDFAARDSRDDRPKPIGGDYEEINWFDGSLFGCYRNGVLFNPLDHSISSRWPKRTEAGDWGGEKHRVHGARIYSDQPEQPFRQCLSRGIDAKWWDAIGRCYDFRTLVLGLRIERLHLSSERNWSG